MKKNRIAYRLTACLLAAFAIVGLMLPASVAAAEDFVVDWDNVTKMEGAGNITRWSVAKGDGGYYIYVEPQWGDGEISIDYATAKVGAEFGGIKYYLWDTGHVYNSYTHVIEGAKATTYNKGGVTYAELFVPDSYFAEDEFALTSGSSKIDSADIPTVDEVNGTTEPTEEPMPTPTEEPTPTPTEKPTPTPTEEPTPTPTEKPTPTPTEEPIPTTKPGYEGIVIDGEFEDWAGVPEYDIDEKKGYDTVNGASVVWDGDMIYIKLRTESSDVGAVTGAGDWGNGQYAITTDLGNQLLVQVKRDGSIGGVNGATAATDVPLGSWSKGPHYWEIAIPASNLPEYSKSFSFGLYQGETIIPAVEDIQGSTGGEFGNHIVIDGEYEDWRNYPHTTIDYATGGTQEEAVDAKGALWSNDGKLYGHVSTNMPVHLDSLGADFLAAVQVAVNGEKDVDDTFKARFVGVDDNGHFTIYPAGTPLPAGNNKFYICQLEDHQETSLEQVLEHSFGTIIVTVDEDRELDQCEFEMDLEKLAEKYNMSPEDVKLIEAQFGRLGDEWFGTAGTSTGAWIGVGLCVATVGSVFIADKSKKKKAKTAK